MTPGALGIFIPLLGVVGLATYQLWLAVRHGVIMATGFRRVSRDEAPWSFWINFWFAAFVVFVGTGCLFDIASGRGHVSP